MAGGIPVSTAPVAASGFLKGKALIFPLSLVISLFFLWGLSYGLLDVLNKHFQQALQLNKLQTTGLQVMYFGGGYFCFAPVAAEVMRRKGYKFTILMGLSLYSLGAVAFWPTAHFSSVDHASASLGGFCICVLIIACGLATLETAANSYAVVIGDPASASARLQFCQAWNGVASFIGPLMASHLFFSDDNANNLTNVQFVYLAVACAGVMVAILFLVTKLPEVSEETLASSSLDTADTTQAEQLAAAGPIWKQYNLFFAFFAQLCYVGAQVTIAAFFINYVTDNASGDASDGSRLFSYALITFTVGRFLSFGLATVLQPDFMLMVYSLAAIAFNAYVCVGNGIGSVIILIVVFFFEAPMYPTLFTLGTENLGLHTRRGAGIMVQGVVGGAIFPPIQGAIAEAAGTRISYIVPLVGFVYVFGYTFFHWFRDGHHIMRVKNVVSEDFFGREVRSSVVSTRIQNQNVNEKDSAISQVESASH